MFLQIQKVFRFIQSQKLMGTYLAQPITSKKMSFEECQTTKTKFSCCQMQGWRRQMEDAAICRPDLGDGNSLFAVFDGHGGFQVSQYVKEIFEKNLVNSSFYQEGKYPQALDYCFHKIDQQIKSDEGEKRLQQISNSDLEPQKVNSPKNIKKRKLSKAQELDLPTPTMFKKKQRKMSKPQEQIFTPKLNKNSRRKLSWNQNLLSSGQLKSPTTNMRNKMNQKISLRAGCTANVVLITPDNYYVANAGDSRSIVCRDKKSFILSFDHKPQNAKEYERITNAGWRVQNGRINGGLNLSRSLGDFRYKKCPGLKLHQQPVICSPQIRTIPRSEKDKFIMIGCDGVFENYYYDQQPLADKILKERKNKKSGIQILSNLFDKLLAKDSNQTVGCDNMTAILVQFL